MLEVIRGTDEKPISTEQLVGSLRRNLADVDGFLYVGYPILTTSAGSQLLDVALVSERHGMVIFDIVEGVDYENREEKRDELFLNAKSRLIQNKNLIVERELAVNLTVVTFAPSMVASTPETKEYFTKEESILSYLQEKDEQKNVSFYPALLSVVQTITKLRATHRRTNVTKENSRGAKLKKIEDSIANLDSKQNQAVIETAKGPQRIRGLAGSGKTIILALKAAYLHSAYPEWNIAVTYNTRTLKGQFVELITKFTIEQTGEEPNWEKLKIINAWGSRGSTGMYYEFCESNDIEPLTFSFASAKYGRKNPFAHACKDALEEALKKPEVVTAYDAILVDEAQDFAYPFLQLCFHYLSKPKRLVWAYDELQNLSQIRMPSPKDLFGIELNNSEDSPKEDIILERCYRNPGPLLVTAHGLGFGIEREEGLVQMFDDPNLWTDIGYTVVEGSLQKGNHVNLKRGNDSSPDFLENHSDINDLIIFKSFEDKESQAIWIANQIEEDLTKEELRHRDVVVITLDARTMIDDVALIRSKLFDKNIASHIPGETTSPDSFFENESVAFTSIYRAKGNEAPMIYIVDGETASSSIDLITNRNKLFSAITRSKAWVRVTGRGKSMDQLIVEYEKIKKKEFQLSFTLPTDEQMEHMRVINRDLTKTQLKEREKLGKNLSELLQKLKTGEIKPNEIEEITQLKMFFDEQKK